MQRNRQEMQQAIAESQIDAITFYREQLRFEQRRNERLKEPDRRLCELFAGYGYTVRDALDGVRLLLERERIERGW